MCGVSHVLHVQGGLGCMSMLWCFECVYVQTGVLYVHIVGFSMCVLWCFASAHCGVLNVQVVVLLSGLLQGSTIITCTKFDPQQFLQTLQDKKV